MLKKELSCYIAGLTNMASSMSKKISYSCITADAFDLDNYKNEFSLYYKIALKNLNFVKVNKSLREILFLYLEEDILDSLLYWIERDIGKEEKVYTIEDEKTLDKFSSFNGGVIPFYFIEDVYIVCFHEYMVCFVVGNNE